ncbi:MAG: hypothetical protein V7784_19080, partial [Oceanospirillaceae bacterium]
MSFILATHQPVVGLVSIYDFIAITIGYTDKTNRAAIERLKIFKAFLERKTREITVPKRAQLETETKPTIKITVAIIKVCN